MTSPIAFVNGELVPLEEARVHVLDQGFRTGEGVFETMRAYDGHTFRLDAHLNRAATGADRLGFAAPPDIASAVTEVVAANHHLGPDLAVRLTITPGRLDPTAPWPPTPTGDPTVVVTVHRLELDGSVYDTGITAVTVDWTREVADVKAVSFLAAMLARREAREAGANEALLTDADGNVTEGASSNVFAVRGGVLHTPPLGPDLLPGVTRATVLEVAPDAGVATREEPLPLDDLLHADEAFVTSSTRELVPLVQVNGQAIGTGNPGPITTRLHDTYHAQVTHERTHPT